MADLSDVATFLAQLAADAVYPNGTSQPSAAGMDVRIYEGWPLPEQLDLDLAGNMLVDGKVVPRPGGRCAHISVFPMQGTTAIPYQLLNNTYTIMPPVHGMAATQAGNTITVAGQPTDGEFLSLIVDQRVIVSRTGATTAAILAALAADLLPDYPGVTADATSITVPNAAYLTARIGAPATLGRVIHRQRQAFMVTVWAPNHTVRTALAIAIDGMVKQRLVVEMPDKSQALVTYNRTNQTDDHENVTVYRRDLIYEVEYATVEQFQGVEITIVGPSINALDTTLQNFPPSTAVA